MRNKLLTTSLATALGLAVGAAQASPISLTGPIFLQYVSAEQVSATNNINNPLNPADPGVPEGNWGIVQVTTIQGGTVLPPIGSDIQGGGGILFADGQNGGDQVLGIWYNVQNNPGGPPTTSTGGVLDLYWWEDNAPLQNTGAELAVGASLAKRTAQNQYTGFTCAGGDTADCTFLVRLNFTGGADPTNYTTTIITPVDPSTADGTSKSYLNVDTGKVGPWTAAWNTNFFTLDANNNPVGTPDSQVPPNLYAATDLRLDNNFTHGGAGAWSVAGTNIVGLRDNDPARVYTTPEPTSLALISLGLLGLGFGMRRKSA